MVRAVAVGGVAQLGAKVLHLGLNVVAGLALIRYLGPSGYGDYVFVFSFSTLLGLLSDFGVTKIAAREMTRDRDASPAILGTSVGARLGLAAIALVLAQAVLALIGTRLPLRLAVAIASLLFVTDAVRSVVVVFQVRLAMQYEALVGVIEQAIDTALILWLISRSAGLLALVAAPVISGVVGVVAAILIAGRRFQLRVELDLRRLPALLAESLPVGLALVVAAAYLKIDSVFLAFLRPRRELGLYGAAYKPIEYLLLASTVLMTTLFPLLARWHGRDHARFLTVYRRGLEILLAFALPIPIIAALLAGPILLAAYAPAFAPAALPLRLLSLALVLMVLNGWQAFALLAGRRQRVTLAYDAAGLLLNVLLNLELISRWGYVGAAFAALITSVFITACSSIAAAHYLQASPDGQRLARVALANALLALILAGFRFAAFPWWMTLALGIGSYPALLLLCRFTNARELALLRSGGARPAGAPAWEAGW